MACSRNHGLLYLAQSTSNYSHLRALLLVLRQLPGRHALRSRSCLNVVRSFRYTRFRHSQLLCRDSHLLHRESSRPLGPKVFSLKLATAYSSPHPRCLYQSHLYSLVVTGETGEAAVRISFSWSIRSGHVLSGLCMAEEMLDQFSFSTSMLASVSPRFCCPLCRAWLLSCFRLVPAEAILVNLR